MEIEQLIFDRTHRVCLDGPVVPTRDASVEARQFDAVLMSIGFKCSGELLAALAQTGPAYVIDKAVRVLRYARQLAGAHVKHNAYFIDFPANVPDTMDFWMGLVMESARQLSATGETSTRGGLTPAGEFFIDLLSLPGYGRYQHTFEEMLALHEELVPALSDRMTIVHLGKGAVEETQALFESLAGSAVPLSGDNLELLRFLATDNPSAVMTVTVPVRENMAVINAARARHGMDPLVTVVTDVLRIAAELSGADVTLSGKVKFTSQPRTVRRALMSALDSILALSERQLEDVPPRAEMWKRLAERLHPHEFGQFPHAQYLFAVARGETDVRSRASRVETEFAAGRVDRAGRQLAVAPGEFYRSLDRLLRHPAGLSQRLTVVVQAEQLAPKVSGRVLLGVREHLVNRALKSDVSRVFANRRGRAWVTGDSRPLLEAGLVRNLTGIIDAEVFRRLPDPGHLVIDPAVLGAALPLTSKPQSEGLGVWPRGSVVPVEGELLRFFTYWRQTSHRTDFDLSALFTDENFQGDSFLSYTSLRGFGGEHSGDITSAPGPRGATEFINVHLDRVPRGYIIPQVYVFAGEGFDEVAENFFGFMTMDGAQKGAPFEARTVRMKAPMSGDGKTAMPLVFFRGEDGKWYAKWLHLSLKGQPSGFGGGYRIEENKVTTKLMARSIMDRQYLRVRYLVDALSRKAGSVTALRDGWQQLVAPGDHVTFIGIEQPEGLPEGSEIYTLASLGGLVPA